MPQHIVISPPGKVYHLGDERIDSWEPPQGQPYLNLTFRVPFIHGGGTLHADVFGVHAGEVHNEVFVNNVRLGHLERGDDDVFKTITLRVPVDALRVGQNNLRIISGTTSGGGHDIDDFLVTNLHLHLPD